MPVEEQDRLVRLSLPSGVSAEIRLFGATVTSWKTPDGRERFYLSSKSAMDGPAAVRGGMPISFPCFGPHPSEEDVRAEPLLKPHSTLPGVHGFARIRPWTLESVIDDEPTSVSVRFAFPVEALPKGFEHVRLSLVVRLSDHSLTSDLHVENVPGSGTDFMFKTATHTYFAVSSSSHIAVEGVAEGQEFFDNMKGRARGVWAGGDITMEVETGIGLTGLNAPHGLVLRDGSSRLRIQQSGFEEQVHCMIWNPKGKAGTFFADMEKGDDASQGCSYAVRFADQLSQEFIACIEPGQFANWKTIAPGERFTGHQTLTVL